MLWWILWTRTMSIQSVISNIIMTFCISTYIRITLHIRIIILYQIPNLIFNILQLTINLRYPKRNNNTKNVTIVCCVATAHQMWYYHYITRSAQQKCLNYYCYCPEHYLSEHKHVICIFLCFYFLVLGHCYCIKKL